MKKLSAVLMMAFFAATALWAQQSAQQPQGGSEPQQEQRPTLGPESGPETKRPTLGPSTNGPLTSTTMNPAELRRVKKIYVGLMDNKLNIDLIDDFAKAGPVRVVASKNAADAILQGTCFDSPRLREVHSEVFLTDKAGKSIWQDVIHQPYRPPSLAQAVSQTANLIVAHLRHSMLQQDR